MSCLSRKTFSIKSVAIPLTLESDNTVVTIKKIPEQVWIYCDG